MKAKYKDLIPSVSWLFLVDIDTPQRKYENYEKAEPGYSAAMLDAYNYAFQAPLSKDLIKEIHKRATAHLAIAKGKVMFEDVHSFPLLFSEMIFNKGIPEKIPCFNATIDGLHQLILFWLTSAQSPHIIRIGGEKDQTVISSCNPVTNKPGIWVLDQSTYTVLEYTKSTLEKYKNKLINMDEKARVFIGNHMYCEDKNIVSFCEKMLEKLYVEYINKIKNEKNRDKKIEYIASYVQLINQLHPFQDGNVRSCYILLNKLLHDNGLPLCLLIDPNKMDAHSSKELVEMIKNGQGFFLKVFQEKVSKYEPYLDNFNLTYNLISADKDLISNFQKNILENLSINSIENNREKEFKNTKKTITNDSKILHKGFFCEKKPSIPEKNEHGFTPSDEAQAYWDENCKMF